jgi:acyl-CoA synthetase (AMP-forming)/AMP-acid ligase II
MRIIDYFGRAAEDHPDRLLAVGEDGHAVTYAEARERAAGIAAGLWAGGFALDDGVAILGANDPLSLCAMFGAWQAGGVWHPVNPRNAADATIALVQDAGSRRLFFHSRYAELAQTICDGVPSIEAAYCLDAPATDPASVDALVAAGAHTTVPDWGDARGNPGKPTAIMPTGGTTGASKLSDIDSQSWSTMTNMAALHWPRVEHPVNLMVAPITHGAGGMAVMLAGLGATIHMRDGFDATDVLTSIERERVTHMFLPPTAYYAMLAHPDRDTFDTSSLRMLLVAAAPVSPERIAEGVEAFGPCIAQCWGQAEAPFMLTWLDPEVIAAAVRGEHPERLRSCGRATFASVVAVMDEDGRLLGPREQGELVARGELVACGYKDRPEDTTAMRAHGWHHTGDVGYRDDHGFFYIVDRLKDMIITGGFNVFSTEVEAALLAIPGVQECAVVGAPDERWGEVVTAVVVPAAGAELDPGELIAQCKERVGSVKAPKHVELTDALPKTPVGKIDKKAIRAPFWAGRDRMVG